MGVLWGYFQKKTQISQRGNTDAPKSQKAVECHPFLEKKGSPGGRKSANFWLKNQKIKYFLAIDSGTVFFQNSIDITGKREQHVVKCSSCSEATPIRIAPPGRKYVRCPCNCLLICKNTSVRVACPRPNCKQVISLVPSGPPQVPVPNVPGMCRVVCAYCHDTFLVS